MTTAVLLILFGALSRLIPHPPNAVALGALALYAGARLPRRWALAVPLAAMALSDLFLDFGTGRSLLSFGRLTIYATFAGIVLAGRLLTQRAGTLRLGSFSVAASSFFFLTSNFAVWASEGLYPLTLSGLSACYAAAVPFLWNTLFADLAGTAVLFGADRLARRAREGRLSRVLPALLLAGAAPSAARAQLATPVSESVVVTATASPEEESELGAAATVITRERIEQGGFRTVLEVLRSVPGVDVIRSGGDGSVTSILLRGANSTHTLVLIDGVRVNSPYFSGYDFALLTTENVERIEIARGPFSALYGSDALGGVVQIFTRPAGQRLSGRLALEGGDAGQRNGSAFVSGGRGPFALAASYRNARTEGDRSNSDWDEKNGSLRLEGNFGETLRFALEGAILDLDLGLPGAVGAETPRTRYGSREERIALPVSFRPADDHQTSFLLARVETERRYDSPEFGFSARTDTRTLQVRGSDTWTAGANRLTGFAEWNRWEVDDRSNFGVNLADDRSTLWGAGVEDTLRAGERWIATAGVRYDHHSQFGDAWSPRATVSYFPAEGWKVRASAGSAFRAPSIGELYYPFSGNTALEPERSASYELGVERRLSGGRAEVSIFWNDLRDLIVYDFVRLVNYNVGRARTRGVELAVRQDLSRRVGLDAGYTWLDAEDRATGRSLLRRPRHQAFLAGEVRPVAKLTVSPRATFVGRRNDGDALSGATVEMPSFLRFDLFARYELAHAALFLRLENLTDRRYEEVDGYPAPRRRYAGGVEVNF